MAVTREELKKTQVIVDFKIFFGNKVKIKNQQNVVLFLNISPLRGPTFVVYTFYSLGNAQIYFFRLVFPYSIQAFTVTGEK